MVKPSIITNTILLIGLWSVVSVVEARKEEYMEVVVSSAEINRYTVSNQNMSLITFNCDKFANRDRAVLFITGGTDAMYLRFSDGSVCDVVRLYRLNP